MTVLRTYSRFQCPQAGLDLGMALLNYAWHPSAFPITLYLVKAVIYTYEDRLESVVCWKPSLAEAQVVLGELGFTIDLVRCSWLDRLPRWWPDQSMTRWDERLVPRLYIEPVTDKPSP